MLKSTKPTRGKLIYQNGNYKEILASDQPFSLLQAIKRQKMAEGIPASKLKITY